MSDKSEENHIGIMLRWLWRMVKTMHEVAEAKKKIASEFKNILLQTKNQI